MKKFLIIALTLAMLCSLFTVNAFADTITDTVKEGQSTDADVKIQLGGSITHVYSVDIEFTGMTFVYGTGATWNPTTKAYDYTDNASWTKGSIKITNNSDMPITYKATNEAVETAYGNITLEMTNSTKTIVKCEIGGTPVPETIGVTLSGKPSLLNHTNAVKLTSITVAIEAAS